MDDQLQFTFLYALVVRVHDDLVESTTKNTYSFPQLLSYFGGVLVLAVVANPWMLITLVVVVVIFLVVRWMYVTAGRELRRLEALCKYHMSNIVSNISHCPFNSS